MPSLVTLSAATIQDDFTTVLSEVHAGTIPSENIWLSCYKDGEPSVHGKISVSLHEQDRDRVELVGTGGVELTRTSQFRYTARCVGLGVNSVDFISPREVYADPSHSDETRPRQIPSFAISNGLLVTALLDGTLSVYSHPPSPSVTATYPIPTTHVLQPTVTTKLHRSVVNALEILPGTSPDPLLASAGSDFTINVTRLPTATSESSNNTPPSLTPLLSFKGHLRPVVSLLPLPNDSLLSASTDGSLCMWDIQSGTQKATWTMPKPVVALAAASDDANGGAWVALADGNVRLVDTRGSTSATKWSAGVTARAIAMSASGKEIALGAADGTVTLFDVHGASIREQWKRSGAPVECVSFAPGDRVLAGGEDGLPYLVDTRGDDHAGLLVSELVFGNVEAVRALRVSGDLVYVSGDGGVVRKYQL